jgi:HK97 family phage major capsid protein
MAALFPQINMPSNPYKLPVVASDMTPFLQTENTTDVNTSSGTQFTASTPGSTNVVFTAIKIAIRTLFSEELTEDAVFPVIDFIKNNLALTMAFGLENALLNGDTTATHMDADVTNAADVRKAWKGLRKLTQTANDVSLSTFNATQLRAMRAKMSKFGVDPSKLAWTCSAKGLMLFLGLAEVITMEKYGDNATIVRGELARLDNIPIIVSEKMRDDLNASGVNDSTTNNKGLVLLTYVPAFLLGLRRAITVRARFDEERDQSVMVSTWRGDFEPLYPVASNATVVKGVNAPV